MEFNRVQCLKHMISMITPLEYHVKSNKTKKHLNLFLHNNKYIRTQCEIQKNTIELQYRSKLNNQKGLITDGQNCFQLKLLNNNKLMVQTV